ncbi:beta-rfap synthase [Halogeometricum borinquense DSM 11551]|uniref:Beta-ribofuranosylaminobenzene 5'-phosphate synthase n=2 Tax=Halogeometricum borinquense TaxID=60847 RepID=E4NPQ8_HALBP|nr:beta-ribofuranosylaminobenzene 5'-phosphate synthase family protein [Halogeometricum borinquense]ADQ66541.1 beta-RFAP synthase [Halogeometricum borinquense DSM 11551]ELY31016.1 beta-rfap synthase [Halogeometricum borinquense DSM 11551]RYJ14403.1 GHMP kinase [Halogeometricum borinquense]
MSRVRVSTGARLHFGFLNLSLAHQRLYGGLGVGLDEPKTVVTATPADGIDCSHRDARPYVETAVEILDVPGADVTVSSALPRHAGLGSGTQLALAVLVAVGRANDREVSVRQLAPRLGRGGRSGIGVASFETGGVLVDAGHPTARFTTDRPADGDWTVPSVAVRHAVPDDWRFLLVVPDADAGRNGDEEDESMRSVVEHADPDIADRISGVLSRRLLPAVADGSASRFGKAVSEIGRLNGAWYADEQGGVYRPPVGELVASVEDNPACYGAGQSSWGPAVYAITDAEHADEARDAGEAALAAADVAGEVRVVRGRNTGADIRRND